MAASSCREDTWLSSTPPDPSTPFSSPLCPRETVLAIASHVLSHIRARARQDHGQHLAPPRPLASPRPGFCSAGPPAQKPVWAAPRGSRQGLPPGSRPVSCEHSRRTRGLGCRMQHGLLTAPSAPRSAPPCLHRGASHRPPLWGSARGSPAGRAARTLTPHPRAQGPATPARRPSSGASEGSPARQRPCVGPAGGAVFLAAKGSRKTGPRVHG